MTKNFSKTLLERLMDDVSQEQNLNEVNIQHLSESIRKNLENLFNTKKRFLSWQDNYVQLKHSVINYGINDFRGMILDSPDSCQDLCEEIREAINVFEPRLKTPKVILEQEKLLERRLQLYIEGFVEMGSAALDLVSYRATLTNPNRVLTMNNTFLWQ